VARRREPRGQRIEDPEPFESVAVRLHRHLRWLVPLAGRRGIADDVEGCGGRRRCAIRRHPSPQRAEGSDGLADLCEVTIDDPIEVAVELGT
jgi:hypothetical protein